jgi:hypothetical protein
MNLFDDVKVFCHRLLFKGRLPNGDNIWLNRKLVDVFLGNCYSVATENTETQKNTKNRAAGYWLIVNPQPAERFKVKSTFAAVAAFSVVLNHLLQQFFFN